MVFTKENYAALYFGHGDDIDQKDVEELNNYLSDSGVVVAIDVTEDGTNIKFFKE